MNVKTLGLKFWVFDQLIFLVALLFSFLLNCAIERRSSLVGKIAHIEPSTGRQEVSSWDFFRLSVMKKLEKREILFPGLRMGQLD